MRKRVILLLIVSFLFAAGTVSADVTFPFLSGLWMQLNDWDTDKDGKIDSDKFDIDEDVIETVGGVVDGMYEEAHTILKADTAENPEAMIINASTLLGRGASGGISSLTPAQTKVILGYIEDAPSDGSTYGRNNATWTVAAGGLAWEVVAIDTTAVTDIGYLIDASGSNITITAIGTPSEGDTFGVCDYNEQATTNTISIARNGSNIEGSAADFTIVADGNSYIFVYTDATRGWEITNTAMLVQNEVDLYAQLSDVSMFLEDLVDDVTPQLGANLDIQTFAIEGVDATEFGYVDGVTSDIQGQINGKEPADATLTALAALLTDENILFDGGLTIGNYETSGGILKIVEDQDDGAQFASFMTPALSASTVYVLPVDDGDAGEQLQSDGAGILSWETAGVEPSGNNNEMLTDDGAGGIVSESNATFDGSTLTITGDISGTGSADFADVTVDGTAEPAFYYRDSDCTDDDVNATIYANATDTGTGAEDVDLFFQGQIAGALTTFWTFDADDASLIVTGNLEATTYGSDKTVTDAELLYINTLSSNAQTQINAKIDNTSGSDHQFVTDDGSGGVSSEADITYDGSVFAVDGGLRLQRVATGAADYNPSIATDDYIIAVDDTAAARAVTISTEDVASGSTALPRLFIIKDESGACNTNNITISLESGNIDGAGTQTLNVNYGSITIYVDGTNGFIF